VDGSVGGENPPSGGDSRAKRVHRDGSRESVDFQTAVGLLQGGDGRGRPIRRAAEFVVVHRAEIRPNQLRQHKFDSGDTEVHRRRYENLLFRQSTNEGSQRNYKFLRYCGKPFRAIKRHFPPWKCGGRFIFFDRSIVDYVIGAESMQLTRVEF